MCDYEATDLENLEIHLKTCEYYKCELCDEIIWQFTDIKKDKSWQDIRVCTVIKAMGLETSNLPEKIRTYMTKNFIHSFLYFQN